MTPPHILNLMKKVLLLSILLASNSYCAKYTQKVLIISMDGFRWDYLNMVDTPNFDKMAAEGVKAPYINNPFITSTFPSHYSLATGLYEESHGIVGNRMYDPEFDEWFSASTKATKWWDGGEPIWITARKGNLRSATYFWPGSEARIQGLKANIVKPYNDDVPFKERVAKVVEWFLCENIDFATLYFHEPDRSGHTFGPNSSEIKQKIKEMDELLGYIMSEINKAGLKNKLNIIMTSDHGMAELDTASRTVSISDMVIDSSAIKFVVTTGAICHILPHNGKVQEVYAALHNKHPNMTVYLKENIPNEYHYRNNRRIMPILVVMDEGWLCTYNTTFNGKGGHGYSNKLMSMKPIFLARGPNFKHNHTVQPFNSVDIYPLMCELLAIPPAPNNGSLSIVQGLLQDTAPVDPDATSMKTCPTSRAGGIQATGLGALLLVILMVLI